jgi:hypothetical protein
MKKPRARVGLDLGQACAGLGKNSSALRTIPDGGYALTEPSVAPRSGASSPLKCPSSEVPIVAGTSVLPVPKYAFAGPGGVFPLLTSLLAPPGPPLPPLDMPVPPPPAANAKPGIKISATVAKDLRVIAFLQVFKMSVEMNVRYVLAGEMLLGPGVHFEHPRIQ